MGNGIDVSWSFEFTMSLNEGAFLSDKSVTKSQCHLKFVKHRLPILPFICSGVSFSLFFKDLNEYRFDLWKKSG